MANEIVIGQGETKTIICKITDVDSLFVATDKFLFAVKNDTSSTTFVFSEEVIVGDLTPVVVEGKNVYSFIVQITSETSRSLLKKDYYYDLTLIDVNGEKKPLTVPTKFTINGTIGASGEKAGA